MATYAPLFAHVEGWQWRPDMIWYDNLRSVPSASYYVQQLYARNKGTKTVPLTMNGKAVAGNPDQHGLFASAVSDEPTGDLIVKAANVSDTDRPIDMAFSGVKKNQGYKSVEITTLHADADAENTLDNKNAVTPQTKTMAIDEAQDWTTILPAKTFAVYRFKK